MSSPGFGASEIPRFPKRLFAGKTGPGMGQGRVEGTAQRQEWEEVGEAGVCCAAGMAFS